MTTPKLDEQVAELMRLVKAYGFEVITSINNSRIMNPKYLATVEAFARAALVASAHPDKGTSALAAPVVPGWTQVPIIDLQELYHSIHGNRFMGEEWEKKCISSMMPKEPK